MRRRFIFKAPHQQISCDHISVVCLKRMSLHLPQPSRRQSSENYSIRRDCSLGRKAKTTRQAKCPRRKIVYQGRGLSVVGQQQTIRNYTTPSWCRSSSSSGFSRCTRIYFGTPSSRTRKGNEERALRKRCQILREQAAEAARNQRFRRCRYLFSSFR